ncbi:MAG: hypothetical protein PF440_10600 [Thiomicrorhabdus sp.]|jgi:hypothetical protein|nr:hypothetical protein [Thiomicrorhabdus sp.]
MGLDCSVKVGNVYTDLDRWWVFISEIRSSEIMTKPESLEKIAMLLQEDNLSNETIIWGDQQEEKIKYHKAWINLARKAIAAGKKDDSVIFYHEHDLPEDYYDLLVPGETR